MYQTAAFLLLALHDSISEVLSECKGLPQDTNEFVYVNVQKADSQLIGIAKLAIAHLNRIHPNENKFYKDKVCSIICSFIKNKLDWPNYQPTMADLKEFVLKLTGRTLFQKGMKFKLKVQHIVFTDDDEIEIPVGTSGKVLICDEQRAVTFFKINLPELKPKDKIIEWDTQNGSIQDQLNNCLELIPD